MPDERNLTLKLIATKPIIDISIHSSVIAYAYKRGEDVVITKETDEYKIVLTLEAHYGE